MAPMAYQARKRTLTAMAARSGAPLETARMQAMTVRATRDRVLADLHRPLCPSACAHARRLPADAASAVMARGTILFLLSRFFLSNSTTTAADVVVKCGRQCLP
jgi:hypothetical protein